MQLPSGESIPLATRRRRLLALLIATALVLGGVLTVLGAWPQAPSLRALTVIERMRDVARLETLDVNVYKKLGYAPEPVATGNVWTDVFLWAKSALAPSRGRAIVFGTVHVGLDLSQLNASALDIHRSTVEVVLPPLVTRAEVRPGETEIIQSNLDSAQTAQLLELARVAFEQDARADVQLQARARASAERAIRGLLFSLGFRDVHFVSAPPGGMGAG
jgi:hypothetical protein